MEPFYQDCNVQIDLDNSRVFNTNSAGHLAAKRLLALPVEAFPCAVVGPYNDIPATELSVIAAHLKGRLHSK